MGDRNGWLAMEKPKTDGKGLKISVPQKVRCSVAWLFFEQLHQTSKTC
jgi:hypothetical protein